jgi:hypothetical protein
MNAQQQASEKLTAAIDDVTALTRESRSIDMRLASYRLATAAIEYRTAVVQSEIDARNAARPGWASLLTPMARRLWKR